MCFGHFSKPIVFSFVWTIQVDRWQNDIIPDSPDSQHYLFISQMKNMFSDHPARGANKSDENWDEETEWNAR